MLINPAQVAAHVTAGRWNTTIHYIDGGIIAERGINVLTGTVPLANSSNPVPRGGSSPDLAVCNKPYVNLESYNPYPISLLSMWPLDPRPDVYPNLMSRPAAAVVALDQSAFGSASNRIGLVDSSGGSKLFVEGTDFDKGADDATANRNLRIAINNAFDAGEIDCQAEDIEAGGGVVVIYQGTNGPAGNSDQTGNVVVSIGDAGCITLLSNFAGGFDSTPYLTSSFGGRGTQIGLTPHRMKEYFSRGTGAFGPTGEGITGSWPDYTSLPLIVSAKPVFEQSFSSSFRDTGYNLYATASYLQLANLMTGTAGELVYSTKPTIFFPRRHAATDDAAYRTSEPYKYDPIGYELQTASLQYNRHTYPYNTPFYATNKIRSRDPFFNSYSEYERDLEVVARDYSIIPEYCVSDHVEYYYENYFLTEKGKNFTLR